jgi:hypothetical protein
MASKNSTKTRKVVTKIIKKGSTKPIVKNVDEKEDESDVTEVQGKVKKPLEIDVADILPETEEKVEDEIVVPGSEEDDEDAPSLDAEDLNPFGDKWEE